jgi:putative pyruvate formate lyase activating enzyme
MYRQKGNVLQINENGIAEKGIIVRHLVLPGAVQNSIGVLHLLAGEVSTRITLSLMSQYHPIPNVSSTEPLNRYLRKDEYMQVVDEMEKLGFSKGWVQDHESADSYFPDFESETPFLTP